MSHIAEGLLHAHLDGALDAGGQLEWSTAEAHLGVCEDCRRRLEEAREVRDAASALLSGAAAPATPRPAFGDLEAEAAERRRGYGAPLGRMPPARPRAGRWWRSPVKLAWAASLVLAASAGWMGRQLLLEQGSDVPRLTAEAEGERTAGRAARANVGFQDDTGPPADEERAAEPPVAERAAEPPAADRGARYRTERVMEEVRAEHAADHAKEADGVAADAVRAGPVEQEAARDGPPEENEVRPDQFVEGAEAGDRREADEALARAAQRDADVAQARDADVEIEPLAAKAPAARCFTSTAGAPEAVDDAYELRLVPDGTVGLRLGERPLVGFWERSTPDSFQVRLTDGEEWFELRLIETRGGLRGTVRPPIMGQAADRRVADRQAADGEAVEAVEFEPEACPGP